MTSTPKEARSASGPGIKVGLALPLGWFVASTRRRVTPAVNYDAAQFERGARCREVRTSA